VKLRPLALCGALTLVLAACGGATDPATAPTADTTTTTTAPTTTEPARTQDAGAGVAGARIAEPAAPAGEGTLADIALRAGEEPVRFEGTVTVTVAATPGAGPEGPVELAMSGEIDGPGDAARVVVDMSALADAALGAEEGELPPGFSELFAEPMEMITIADRAWMRFALLNLLFGVPTPWVELPADAAGEITGDMGLGNQALSPSGLLERFRDADARVEELGAEDLRGIATTRYRLLIDVVALAGQLPEEKRAQLEAELAGHDEVPIELWVDGDGRLHRYVMELSAGDPAQDQVHTVVEVDFFDHGSPVTIASPPADQVTTLDDLDAPLGGGPGSGG
jgi:hypothetical protein